jgi:LysR family cys regulon transcriptional activator
VIKAYAAQCLGIAILPTIAYEPARDPQIEAIDATRWFVPKVARIEVRRDNYLRPCRYEFLLMIAPHLERNAIDRALRGEPRPTEQQRSRRATP